jgi:hypothetical protein
MICPLLRHHVQMMSAVLVVPVVMTGVAVQALIVRLLAERVVLPWVAIQLLPMVVINLRRL